MGIPSLSSAVTLACEKRATGSTTPGTDKQPSSDSMVSPKLEMIGLIKTCSWSWVSEISMTTTRFVTFTWVAAKPMPGAAYMV